MIWNPAGVIFRMGITVLLIRLQIAQKGKNGSIVRIFLPILKEKSCPNRSQGNTILGGSRVCSKVKAVKSIEHGVQKTKGA